MKMEKDQFSKTKIWLVFIILFVCGSMVGFGIANWGHAIKNKQAEPVVTAENIAEAPVEKSCQAVERVLLGNMHNHDDDCDLVKRDLEAYKKLADFGCPENHDKFVKIAQSKIAILDVMCSDVNNPYVLSDKPCAQIEQNLQNRLGDNYVNMDAEDRIRRAKLYSVMAERGCPENTAKYTELAKQELEIARGISDDKLDEQETLEAVETYKRLKMQQDAEEIFDKVKKMTNPAIDFIMQVEKIINE